MKTINQFILTRHKEIKFTGTENECFYALQRMQSQSADWAMKYEGWRVEEQNPIFKTEWSKEDFALVESAILKHFTRRQIKNHRGEMILFSRSYKQIDNTLGLAYTSSSKCAMYGVCNIRAFYNEVLHYEYFALSENNKVFSVLQDNEEKETLLQLSF